MAALTMNIEGLTLCVAKVDVNQRALHWIVQREVHIEQAERRATCWFYAPARDEHDEIALVLFCDEPVRRSTSRLGFRLDYGGQTHHSTAVTSSVHVWARSASHTGFAAIDFDLCKIDKKDVVSLHVIDADTDRILASFSIHCKKRYGTDSTQDDQTVACETLGTLSWLSSTHAKDESEGKVIDKGERRQEEAKEHAKKTKFMSKARASSRAYLLTASTTIIPSSSSDSDVEVTRTSIKSPRSTKADQYERSIPSTPLKARSTSQEPGWSQCKNEMPRRASVAPETKRANVKVERKSEFASAKGEEVGAAILSTPQRSRMAHALVLRDKAEQAIHHLGQRMNYLDEEHSDLPRQEEACLSTLITWHERNYAKCRDKFRQKAEKNRAEYGELQEKKMEEEDTFSLVCAVIAQLNGSQQPIVVDSDSDGILEDDAGEQDIDWILPNDRQASIGTIEEREEMEVSE